MRCPLSLFLSLLAVVFLLFYPLLLKANPPPLLTHDSNPEFPETALTDLEEELAWSISLVAANEGALWGLMDVALVHQVVVANVSQRPNYPTETLERHIEFLKKHSGRVLGAKPCFETGNCQWVRQLSKTAHKLPASVASGSGGPKDWEAYWRIEMAPRWQRVMDFSRALVSGEVVVKPCRIEPRTWGSLKNGLPDLEVALANGLWPIGCKGTRNDGFAPLSGWPVARLDTNVRW